jgi:hypothetical protein
LAQASAGDKSSAAAAGKQSPGASADQLASDTAHPVRPAGSKPRAGAYANPDAPASKRKPRARAKPQQPASGACQAIPGK